jgi:exodeoxyribonuclease V alpha subunit
MPAGVTTLYSLRKKNGVCGVDALNKVLQNALNPANRDKAEHSLGWVVLREGDKVLQTRNNYKLEVFNGYTGEILAIQPQEGGGVVIIVDFDGQVVRYEDKEDIRDLTLGYCLTVHKSQGSTFENGVVVCHSSHYYMMNRSLFYTALSRFRGELSVVGDRKAIKRSISNVVSGERNTYLKLKLQGEV